MNPKFCTLCDNLLSPVHTDDKLAFRCNVCHVPYKTEPEDTLRHERIKESDVMVYEKLLTKAIGDDSTIKARVKCIEKKCSNDIVKQVRLKSNLKLYNICTRCNTTWSSY